MQQKKCPMLRVHWEGQLWAMGLDLDSQPQPAKSFPFLLTYKSLASVDGRMPRIVEYHKDRKARQEEPRAIQ
jgi:hypothetical protein